MVYGLAPLEVAYARERYLKNGKEVFEKPFEAFPTSNGVKVVRI